MPKRKSKRGRIKSAADALEQLRQIQEAQESVRERGKAEKIRSIEKSKNRFRNANRNLRSLKDFEDEYQ
ncbi:MAG TPA: hypothetical protein VM008_10530 [Phycisphaerae bacterium]|nr:hypothetical protein [Phycisphaerae bacterium]